jgi:hypothetical protein
MATEREGRMHHGWVVREVLAAKALGAPNEGLDVSLLRLIDTLGIEVEHAAVCAPVCMWTRAGPKIVVPVGWVGWSGDRRLVHELGHAVLGLGVGPVLMHLADGDPKMERLGRLWIARDEAVASEFVELWCGQEDEGCHVWESIDPRAE